MSDKNKIIIGLIIFSVIFTTPFWINMGRAIPVPEIELTEKAKKAEVCVEPVEFMRKYHMSLLDDWRDAVVWDGDRIYVSTTGKEYRISLSGEEESCMGCHYNKAEFCDRCHDYVVVEPDCWDCHIEPPKEEKN